MEEKEIINEEKENIEKNNNSQGNSATLIGIILIVIAVLIYIHILSVAGGASHLYKGTTGQISQSPYCVYFNNRIDSGLINISFLILIIVNIIAQISLRKTNKGVLVLAIVITIVCWFLSFGEIISCNGVLDHSCEITDSSDC